MRSLLITVMLMGMSAVCSNTAICPYDGAQALWTGQAKHSGSTMVGEYRHGSHVFWQACE